MTKASLELGYKDLAFSVTEEEVQRLAGAHWSRAVIGQPRALEALQLGTAIRAKGYNVFVTGAPGTGRRTAVGKVLSEAPPPKAEPRDAAYVYNFRKPGSPRVLYFGKGEARKFKKDVHKLVEAVKRIARFQAESESYKARETALQTKADETENAALAEFESELAAGGFQVTRVTDQGGQEAADILPLMDGKPSSFDELQTLVASGSIPEEDFNARRRAYYEAMDKMKRVFEGIRKGRLDLERELEGLRETTLKPMVAEEIRALLRAYPHEKTQRWLCDLERDILQHLFLFSEDDDETEAHPGGRPPALGRYGVNVVLDTADQDRPPLIHEAHPTYLNLFGSIESHQEGQGDARAAYLKVRAGSIVQASGGYLVLRAEEVIQEEDCWSGLKRVLQTGKVEIQGTSGPFGQTGGLLKPEPIEVDVKVVMIGSEQLYDALYQADADFQKLFKVSAEFDSSMPKSDETTAEYVAFCKTIAEDEELLPLGLDGIAAVIEQGIRLSDYRNRLSTRFSLIADLLREAGYRAALAGRASIDGQSVTEAIERRAYLAGMPEEKLGDMIVSGEIILKVSGRAVGRVNGLAVHDRGYYAFGMPAVISAQVSPGESGVINIEGESGLSGEIYDKAVLIVEGFLRSRYARRFPLSITASVCFEQSYTAVEGDSASSTAVYALLSAIADVPLRQDIAVTGSVNQIGQIQPVGGINEKIEGFYRVCRQAGFTGTQGVMVPRRNVVNLTLSRQVQKAVEEGKFHVWAVSTIDEGIEVLTGMEAGGQDKKGEYPQESFNGLVHRSLLKMARTVREYQG